MHDGPFLEGQLVAHVEPMEEDEQPPLGSTIDKEQTYVHEIRRVAVFEDTCPQEVLEADMIVLQEEHEVFSKMREDLFEMVVHPYLSLPIVEVKISAMSASRVIVSLSCTPVLEYIDKACNTSCPLFPIIERGVGFLRHILLIDQT